MKTLIKRSSLTSLFLFAIIMFGFGQKPILLEGDLDFLKDQIRLNAQFDYSNMSAGKYDTEQEYLDKYIAKKNKRRSGSGDLWAEKWVNNRKALYEPKFKELFNKNLADEGVTVGYFPDAKYTIIIQTMDTESATLIDTDIWFVETANLDKVEAQITIRKIEGKDPAKLWRPGIEKILNPTNRLEQAYALCGKTLAKYIKKNVF